MTLEELLRIARMARPSSLQIFRFPAIRIRGLTGNITRLLAAGEEENLNPIAGPFHCVGTTTSGIERCAGRSFGLVDEGATGVVAVARDAFFVENGGDGGGDTEGFGCGGRGVDLAARGRVNGVLVLVVRADGWKCKGRTGEFLASREQRRAIGTYSR